jgi:hypothetical protein
MSVQTMVGAPNASGIKDALTSYGVGVAGGAVYGFSQKYLGKYGIVGSIGGAVLAGSMIKGVRGEMIATLLGYTAGLQFVSSMGNKAASSAVDTI